MSEQGWVGGVTLLSRGLEMLTRILFFCCLLEKPIFQRFSVASAAQPLQTNGTEAGKVSPAENKNKQSKNTNELRSCLCNLDS